MPLPYPTTTNLPSLSTDQMVEVDRLMIEEYGITLLQMMENAGRNLADFVEACLAEHSLEGRIVVVCGGGNNGGGGLACARHLHNRGHDLLALLTTPAERLKEVPARQLGALVAMGVPVSHEDFALAEAGLIVDAIVGYGLTGEPRPSLARWIAAVNHSEATVVSLDAPTGIDTSAGALSSTGILADYTLTLALPKVGLLESLARSLVGELFVADISVPPSLYRKLGIDLDSPFTLGTIAQVI